MTHPLVTATPSASAARTRRDGHRRADIQGLRALAILMVVAFHASLSGAQSSVGGTFTGVDIFFVISGFVITGAMLRREPSTIRAGLADFYARRARRILPALSLMIVVVAALSVLFLSPLGPQQQAARTGAAASVFAANVQLYQQGTSYFGLSSHSNPLLHTWSLAVEEQFYLVFPALLFVVWKLADRMRHRLGALPRQLLFVGLSLGAGASFLVAHVLSSQDPTLAFYSSPTRAWEFGTGVLLALMVPVLARIPRVVGTLLGVAGAGLIVITIVRVAPGGTFPGTAALLPVGGAALVIAAGTVSTQGISALLSTPPAVWLGDRSYSWYLWHWPALVFARALWPDATSALLVVALASIVPACISYRFLETPIRFDPRNVSRRALKLAVVCVTAPLLACAGLALIAHVAARSDVARSLVRQVLPLHADAQRSCDTPTPLGSRHDPACTWRTENPKGEIVLVGDSNAGQFTEPAARAANDADFDFTVATASSCPFADLDVEAVLPPFGTGFSSLHCQRFVERSLDALVRRHPSLVIVAMSSSDYINDDDFHLRDAKTGATASSRLSKEELLATGLSSALRRLDRAGIPVILVHVIPHIPGFSPRECPAVRMFLGSSSCGAAVSRAHAEEERRRAITAENRALGVAPSAVGVDFIDQLCKRDECSARRGKLWLYRDRNHLSVPGSRTLTGLFGDLVAAHAERA